MKKERSAFFQNQSSAYYYPNSNVPFQNMPITSQTSSNYYDGPINQNYDEFESRLAKAERQINRLDSRITKLESSLTEDNSIDYSSSTGMYML